MAAFKAASFKMESGIWFFTKRFGRGLVGGGGCTSRSEAAIVPSMADDRILENVILSDKIALKSACFVISR